MFDDKLQVDSCQGQVIFKYPVVRNPSLLEKPAADSTPPDETRRYANYGESQRSSAGQEEHVSNYELEEKEEPKPELECSDNEHKVTAGCEPRVLAKEANFRSHISQDTGAAIKQELVDDCVRGGVEEGARRR